MISKEEVIKRSPALLLVKNGETSDPRLSEARNALELSHFRNSEELINPAEIHVISAALWNALECPPRGSGMPGEAIPFPFHMDLALEPKGQGE
ncbi:hypothetical protein E1301_Tti012757 [Triplophysa tibetana]|uniref:Uncharacterized protein n=1 Tax=Triplophysa tibetana TaxID=1572043 RepID=A0A5A9NSQ2_9TELE|nr:hypothetical protein E1301_Tti012757 [Triplophysa tibetana]